MLEVLAVAGLGAAGFFVWSGANQNRQESFEYLRRHGFRETGRLTAKGGSAIVFDDYNREIACVSSTMRERLPYDQISQWIAEPQPNAPAAFYIHTLNTRCPLITLRINQRDMHQYVATMTAHLQGQPLN